MLLIYCGALLAQKPLIFPGGVVNAATGTTTTAITYPSAVLAQGVVPNSIVSIFGQSLAASAAAAGASPLPSKLAGTTVTVNGVAAPLFYVSPGQINFQNPGGTYTPGGTSIVVTTAGGSSPPYVLDSAYPGFGIFTLNGSGCGSGAVLNVSPDGTTSLNTSANSVSPGGFLTLFGTGLYYGNGYNLPPLGTVTPSSPLVAADPTSPTLSLFDLSVETPQNLWAGRAPGLVGVDQVDVQVPATVREGCAVPLQILAWFGENSSQAVPISITKGGGSCVDPPSAGFGDLIWQKTTITTTAGTSQTETLTASLQTSPGQQAPPLPLAEVGYYSGGINNRIDRMPPSCPIPGYRSLDAGTVTVQGGALVARPASLIPFSAPPIGGLSAYQVSLPNGTISPGQFTVAATGGADVGPFQSGVTIGSDIQITTPLAGQTFSLSLRPFEIDWTGGDANSWVTITFLNHVGNYDRAMSYQTHTSNGKLAGDLREGMAYNQLIGPNSEIILEVRPDPLTIPTFDANGLSLGGRHSWKYTHRFENVVLN